MGIQDAKTEDLHAQKKAIDAQIASLVPQLNEALTDCTRARNAKQDRAACDVANSLRTTVEQLRGVRSAIERELARREASGGKTGGSDASAKKTGGSGGAKPARNTGSGDAGQGQGAQATEQGTGEAPPEKPDEGAGIGWWIMGGLALAAGLLAVEAKL